VSFKIQAESANTHPHNTWDLSLLYLTILQSQLHPDSDPTCMVLKAFGMCWSWSSHMFTNFSRQYLDTWCPSWPCPSNTLHTCNDGLTSSDI
jgi:hypothetical protein